MEDFDHLKSLTQLQLFERRSALVGSAPNGNYRALSDEVLQELVAIHRILRKHSAPKAARKPDTPTLDML